jgi:hypothetical protein
LQIDPNLYSASWNRFGLIDPDRIPVFASSALIDAASATPLGVSHSTCSASFGTIPVSRFTSAASANFSSMFVAAAAC